MIEPIHHHRVLPRDLRLTLCLNTRILRLWSVRAVLLIHELGVLLNLLQIRRLQTHRFVLQIGTQRARSHIHTAFDGAQIIERVRSVCDLSRFAAELERNGASHHRFRRRRLCLYIARFTALRSFLLMRSTRIRQNVIALSVAIIPLAAAAVRSLRL